MCVRSSLRIPSTLDKLGRPTQQTRHSEHSAHSANAEFDKLGKLNNSRKLGAKKLDAQLTRHLIILLIPGCTLHSTHFTLHIHVAHQVRSSCFSSDNSIFNIPHFTLNSSRQQAIWMKKTGNSTPFSGMVCKLALRSLVVTPLLKPFIIFTGLASSLYVNLNCWTG